MADDGGAPVRSREPERPWWSLKQGARYFERDGLRAPLLLRNVSAPSAGAFTELFSAAREAGTSVVRLQLTQGFGYDTLGMTRDGDVLESWASSWDAVLDEAERQGLGAIVVLTLWGDWNDGSPALGWSHYDANPLSAARGGPAASPADLFADTETQRRWLAWLSALVERWRSRPNVIAWEIFSELDLASGVSEASATAFVERAHAVVRASDPWRPAFASTSDLPLIEGRPWQALWDSPGNDLVSIHPYAADLDRVATARAREVWHSTSKPVLIGESGLDAAAPDGTTLTSAPRAAVGLEHALWAELVSGATSARALYWEDGYAVYYPGTGLPLVTRHHGLEREAARWLAGKDFRDRVPASVTGDPALFGVAVADATGVFGWARNDRLAPPAWSAPPLGGARVDVALPLDAPDATWTVTLTRPTDGAQTEIDASVRAGVLSFDVAQAFESFAFEARRLVVVPPVCPEPTKDACAGPIYALALDGVSLFDDPQCPSRSVYLHPTECRSRLRATLSSCISDEVSELPLPCVEFTIDDFTAPSGSGVYYDAAGAAFDLSITEVELPLDAFGGQSLQSGVVRGTLGAQQNAGNGDAGNGDAGTRVPFELSFSACFNPLTACLF